MTWAECAECGLVFTNDNSFDRHRVFTCDHTPNGHVQDECWPNRRCLAEAELTGWRQDRHGRWTHRPYRQMASFDGPPEISWAQGPELASSPEGSLFGG